MENQLNKVINKNNQSDQQQFQHNKTYPIPLCAKQAKYHDSLPLSQLKFLQYYMIPEKDQFDYVYKPGDDSFFMLNVLKRQIDNWIKYWGQQSQSLNNIVISQIGSGSGIISVHVSSWLKQLNQSPLIHLSIDVNLDASIMSQKYYNHYNLPIEQITTSLYQNTLISQNILFDLKPKIIFFNPPYIPVEQEQIQNQYKYLVEKLKYIRQNKKCIRKKQQNMIAYSYMGGTDGLKVTRKLLKSIFWSAWVYIIVMEEQWYLQLRKQIQDHSSFWEKYQNLYKISANTQLMQYMKFQNEDLFLLKVQINSQTIQKR